MAIEIEKRVCDLVCDPEIKQLLNEYRRVTGVNWVDFQDQTIFSLLQLYHDDGLSNYRRISIDRVKDKQEYDENFILLKKIKHVEGQPLNRILSELASRNSHIEKVDGQTVVTFLGKSVAPRKKKKRSLQAWW